MKKSIISFVAFCVAFVFAFGFIYTKANPAVSLPETQNLEWHGHIENEFGTYNGTLLDDLFNGHGDFAFVSGEKYVGDWDNSYMSGTGSIVFPAIGEYSGELVESKRNGYGTFTWFTGEEYIGDWENDEMSGQGQYTFENGCVFIGTFQSNQPIEGTLKYKAELDEEASETDIVEFTYVFSGLTKTITFSTKGGLKYNGDVSALYSTGTATVTYPSGNTYSGELSNGQRHGTGTYTWKSETGGNQSYFEGKWENDHMNGQGKYHYSSSEYPYLTGNFENDLPTGTLTYYKAAGNTFETTWSNGSCTNVKET